MVKDQVDVEVVAVDGDAALPGNEEQVAAQLEQEALQPVDEDRPVFFADKRIKVTPIRVDHSIPGACGFLIETSGGKTVAISGDFRLHGTQERRRLSEHFIDVVRDRGPVDLLIVEGTNIDEFSDAVEEARGGWSVKAFFKAEAERAFAAGGMVFVGVSGNNVERIDSIFEVCKELGGRLHLSVYNASVLERLRQTGAFTSRDHVTNRLLDRKHVVVYERYAQEFYRKFPDGDDAYWSFIQRLASYRREDLSVPSNRRKPMGCTILREARFWPERRWIRWHREEGWAPNIVQGKAETNRGRAALLMDQIALDAATPPEEFAPEFELVDADNRLWVESRAVQREGQGTFRLRLLDAYGRCAITAERTEPVLDAAHIQPYRGPASNHLQNGLLLTKEFHTLFDKGYVTVTPDYTVRASAALADTWNNGKRYYAFDGRPLRRMPERAGQLPSREALAWHGEAVFLG